MLDLPPIQPEEQAGVWDYTIELAGAQYRIKLEWMERQEAWYISLFDSGDNALWTGERMRPDYPLGWRHRAQIDGGYLILVCLAGDGADPGYDDLGWSHVLIFLEAADTTPDDPPEAITIA